MLAGIAIVIIAGFLPPDALPMKYVPFDYYDLKAISLLVSNYSKSKCYGKLLPFTFIPDNILAVYLLQLYFL